ncbi:MAG: hypothetical protein FWG71_05520 [Synergistaceae bacterium]|nr:hypothetical protein [Synergistaceae bacterium]
MLVKVSKKLLLVLAVLVFSGSSALYASDNPLIGTTPEPEEEAPAARSSNPLLGGQAEDASLTQTLPGGIDVTYTGIFKHGETLEASYTIVTTRDRRVAIDYDNSQLVDANDVNILPSYDGRGVRVFREGMAVGNDAWNGGKEKVGAGAYINDEKQDTLEFLANQPYKLMLRYWIPATYVLTPTFQSVIVVVNGLPVEFKDVSVFP